MTASSVIYYFKGQWFNQITHYHIEHSKSYYSSLLARLDHDELKPREFLKKLIFRLKNNPKEAQGWYFLSKMYYQLNQLQQAYSSSKKAHHLIPNDTLLATHYLEMSFYYHKAKQNNEMRSLIQWLRVKDPNNLIVQNIAALLFYNDNNFQQALKLWHQMLHSNQLTDYEKKQITILAHRAEKKIQLSYPLKLIVDYKLSDKLKHKSLKHMKYVYVIIREKGKLKPLWSIKKKVSNNPLQFVTLSIKNSNQDYIVLPENKELIIDVHLTNANRYLISYNEYYGSKTIFFHSIDKPVQNETVIINKIIMRG